MWNDLDEISSLIGYNSSQFAAACIDTIVEMVHKPEKRHLPLIVRMVDQAKVAQEESELLIPKTENKSKRKKSLSQKKKNPKNLLNSDP